MKSGLIYRSMLLMLTSLLMIQTAAAQNKRYAHPIYDISIEASANWHQVLQEVNGKKLCLTHPNQNMSITLSYIHDCRNPRRFIKRISGSKGLICTEGQFDTLLNDQTALILKGCCVQGKRPYQRMLIGFPVDKGLYLVEISSPLECSAGNSERVKTILRTVRVGQPLSI